MVWRGTAFSIALKMVSTTVMGTVIHTRIAAGRTAGIVGNERFPADLMLDTLRIAANDELGELADTFDAMLARLEVAFERQRQFTADASHELRTPLTSIIGSLQLVNTGVMGEVEPDILDLTSVAERNGQRLLDLINDILDIEKIESGQMEFDLQPLDLGELARRAVFEAKVFQAQGDYARAAEILGINRATLRRKLREAVLAWELTQKLSKDQILEVYMNQIFLGQRAYGFAAASEWADAAGTIDYEIVTRIGALPGATVMAMPQINQGMVRFLDQNEAEEIFRRLAMAERGRGVAVRHDDAVGSGHRTADDVGADNWIAESIARAQHCFPIAEKLDPNNADNLCNFAVFSSVSTSQKHNSCVLPTCKIFA